MAKKPKQPSEGESVTLAVEETTGRATETKPAKREVALPPAIAALLARAKDRQNVLTVTERAIQEEAGAIAKESTLQDAQLKKYERARAVAREAESKTAFAPGNLATLEQAHIITSEDRAIFEVIDAQIKELHGTQDTELKKVAEELRRARADHKTEVVRRAQEEAREAREAYDAFFKPYQPISTGPGEKEVEMKKPGLFLKLWQEALGINQAMDAAQKKETETVRGEAVRRLEALERRHAGAEKIINKDIMQTKPGTPSILDEMGRISAVLIQKMTETRDPKVRDQLNNEAREALNKLRNQFIVHEIEFFLDRGGQANLIEVFPMTPTDDPRERIQGKTRYEILLGDLQSAKFRKALEGDPKLAERCTRAMDRDRALRLLWATEPVRRAFFVPAEERKGRHAAKERARQEEQKRRGEAEKRAATEKQARIDAEARRRAEEEAETARQTALRAAREQATAEKSAFEREVEDRGGFFFELNKQSVGIILAEGKGKNKGRLVITEVWGPGTTELAQKHQLFKGMIFMENNRNVPDAMRRSYIAWKQDQEVAAAAARKAAEEAAAAPEEEEMREQAS